MKNLREIIPKNLIYLRKQHKMTQLELAKKLNYSDKAISRWEKGEVLPDVEVLQNICNIYNISIEEIFKEDFEESFTKIKDSQLANKIIVAIFLMCVVWTAITISFVYLKIVYHHAFWQAFVWGVPITCLIGHIFNQLYFKNKKITFILHTIFIWSLLTSVYVQFLSYNLWLIFLIGIPVQGSIIASAYIKKK